MTWFDAKTMGLAVVAGGVGILMSIRSFTIAGIWAGIALTFLVVRVLKEYGFKCNAMMEMQTPGFCEEMEKAWPGRK